MKDRIRQLMESLHMNQQTFASFVGIAPATLNGIYQERTRPTLNTVEAICKKMPNVNLMWLINGTGEMYVSNDAPETTNGVRGGDVQNDIPDSHNSGSVPAAGQTGMLDFDMADAPPSAQQYQTQHTKTSVRGGNYNTQSNIVDVKNIDKTNRRITEIRVFYDDQTWESFVPKR